MADVFLRDILPTETFPLRIDGREHCLNPSIAVHNGKLETIVRTVNYRIDDAGRYVMPPEDGETIKTRNFLAELLPAGTLENVREIIDPIPRLPTLVRGYEDFRLVSVRGERLASATVRDRREDMACQIVICTIDDAGVVTKSHVQPPVHPGRPEKNWMPSGGDRLTFLYDVVTWVDYNPKTGRATLRPYFQSPFAPELTKARGGAIDRGLAIVHEVDYENGKRIYRHRFVLYNEEGEIEAISPLFSFQHVGIEFCAGLARHDGKVWLTYGVHDAEAFACCVDEKELLAWAFGEKRLVFPRPVVHRSRFCPFLVLPCAADVAYFDACEGGAPEAPHIAWAESLLAPGEVFVDVGAHVGTWAIYFALRGHPTYAFEAHPEIARMLRAGAALCNVDISVGEYALSDQEGKAVWRNPAHNSFSGGGGSIVCDYHGDTSGHTQVTTSTLDSVEWGERVALLKIDVEGAELEVLRGGFRFLREHRPRILLEVWDRWRGSGPSPRDALFALLDENGYDVRQTTWPEVWVADPRAGAEPKRDDRPRFITTTLTNSQEAIIGDALRSVVDWADACIVIDTGVRDGTLRVADQVCGPKLITREFPWRRDFAAARTFALKAAGELAKEKGWTNAWAVTLDTDERILECPPKVLPTADHILTPDEAKGYFKWRLFRLPAKGHYRGRTHEYYADGGTNAQVPWMRFTELAKSEANNQHKFERDLQILKEETKAYPKDARWWFYLGETLRNLKRYKPAAEAYAQCLELDGWDEEGAWAAYQTATCHVELKDLRSAIRSCAAGLWRHPGMPELAWLAGWCSLEARDWTKAEMWARLAIAHGCFGKRIGRTGFRYHLGMYDGPYAVLKDALNALGKRAEAEEAEGLRVRAEELRQQGEIWT